MRASARCRCARASWRRFTPRQGAGWGTPRRRPRRDQEEGDAMTGATRRAFVGAAVLCASAGLQAARALAQETGGAAGLRLLVPAAPGGGWDGTAQAMAGVLRETGAVAEVRIEHLPGAGGALALQRLVTGLRGQH